jgi:hypothetical protein
VIDVYVFHRQYMSDLTVLGTYSETDGCDPDSSAVLFESVSFVEEVLPLLQLCRLVAKVCYPD